MSSGAAGKRSALAYDGSVVPECRSRRVIDGTLTARDSRRAAQRRTMQPDGRAVALAADAGRGFREDCARVSPTACSSQAGWQSTSPTCVTSFNAIGHDVTVMAPRGDVGGLEKSDGYYGIGRTITIPGNGSKMRLTFDVTLYADVKSIMRRERFDIVHLHEPLMPVLPYMVLLNSKAVNVATFHAYSGSQPWYTALKPYMSFVLTRLDARIAVSRTRPRFRQQVLRGRVRRHPERDRCRPLRRARRAVSLGERRHAPDPLRGTVRGVAQGIPLPDPGDAPGSAAVPECETGRDRLGPPREVPNLMERYGVDNVEFQGFVSQEDKARYYASADVCCVPSTGNESFGYVIVEPMAAGRPVVATNIPGYASVPHLDKNAVLVEPRDPQALALASCGCSPIATCGTIVRSGTGFGPAIRLAASGAAGDRVPIARRRPAAVHAPWRQRSHVEHS